MNKIYKRAQHVIVWLGEQLITDSYGLDLIRKINDFLSDDRHAQRTIDHDTTSIPPVDRPSWYCLVVLYNKPWFRDIWSIQDFVYGKRCIMWCGELETKPRVLMLTTQGLRDCEELRGIVTAQSSGGVFTNTIPAVQIMVLWLVRKGIKQGKRIKGLTNLRESLRTTHTFEATDARDRVFALIGLTGGVDSYFIDYHLSVSGVFIRTARFLICEDARADIEGNKQLFSFYPLSEAGNETVCRAGCQIGLRYSLDHFRFCSDTTTLCHRSNS